MNEDEYYRKAKKGVKIGAVTIMVVVIAGVIILGVPALIQAQQEAARWNQQVDEAIGTAFLSVIQYVRDENYTVIEADLNVDSYYEELSEYFRYYRWFSEIITQNDTIIVTIKYGNVDAFLVDHASSAEGTTVFYSKQGVAVQVVLSIYEFPYLLWFVDENGKFVLLAK